VIAVYCLDSCFLIDVASGDAGAARKVRAMEGAGATMAIAAPALTEVLVGAHVRGGAYLRRMTELLAPMDVWATEASVAREAGELGAEMRSRGFPTPTVDLIIAATARSRAATVVTRDEAFGRIPGIAVEAY
jgi:predicted nucleic acid-binding protein